MTDNQMMIALIAEIEAQLTLVGLAGFEVSRNQQPTNQYAGASKDDTIATRVFLHPITKGSDGHSRIYTNGAQYQRTDLQHKTKTIQVSVLHYFDYTDVNSRTPEDIADLVHDLLDSPDAIRNLREQDIYLQEVQGVRPIFTINDTDRNESTPNFDIVVNYTSSITKDQPEVFAPVVDDIRRV